MSEHEAMTSDDARAALDVAAAARRAGARRAAPPLWLRASLAAVIGLDVAIEGLPYALPLKAALLVAMLGLIVWWGRIRSGATPRRIGASARILVFIGTYGCLVLMDETAQHLRESPAATWPPFVLGAAAALIFLAASEMLTRAYLRRYGGDEGGRETSS